MSDYIIATVSTADLEKDWCNQHDVKFISYTYVMDGEVYVDDCSEESKQILYKKMREGVMPNTSAITEFQYEEFFKSLLDTGKDVIFLDMSRDISSSIRNAEQAMQEIIPNYPNQKFHFVDSFCITGGLAMLVRDLVEMKENGASFDEVVEYAENNKDRYTHWFTCDDLIWLKKGGRCSSASAIVGTMLSIKPILQVLTDGSLYVTGKVRGRKSALKKLVENTDIDWDPELSPKHVMIYDADAKDEAEKVKQMMLEKHPEIKEISLHNEGPVIGSHVGPGFISIHYIGKERKTIKY